MKKILCTLLAIASVGAFASIGDIGHSVDANQDFQKVKMYNSAKDNACFWQGSTPYPIANTRWLNEVANVTVYYKHNDSDDWKKEPYITIKNLAVDANGLLNCQTTYGATHFAYGSLGYFIISDKDTSTKLYLSAKPPKNTTNLMTSDNIVTYSMSDNKPQLINGKDVVCTINGTGSVLDYTKEAFTLLCEDKQ